MKALLGVAIPLAFGGFGIGHALPAWAARPPQVSSSAEARSYFERARELEKKGEIPAAIIELKNAVRADSEWPDAKFALGVLYLRVGSPELAQGELEAAGRRGFDANRLIAPLCEAYLAQSHPAKVIENFDPVDFSGDVQSELFAIQARAHIALKSLRAARVLIDRALTQSPNAPRVVVAVFIAKASLAREEENYADAANFIDQGLAVDPDNADLLVLKAQVATSYNDIDGALKILDRTLAVRPGFARARILRATVNLSRGKPELITDDVMTVLRGDPKNQMGLYLYAFLLSQAGRYHEANEVFLMQALDIAEAYPPARYLEAATAFADNQFERALNSALLYLEKAPGDIAGSKLLAAISLRMGDPKRAVRVLEPLARQQPEDNSLRLQLATAYMDAGRSNDAVRLFEEGLKEDPKNQDARLALADSQLRSGAVAAGIEQLEKVVEAAPNSLRANATLVMAQIQTRHFDKARAVAAAMIKANPNDPNAHNLWGTVSLAANELPAARTSFKTALEKDPKFVSAMLNLAHVEERSKDPAAARKWYEKVHALDPSNLSAFNGLADLALEERKPDQAANILEDAITANPTSSEPRLRLIELLMSMGKLERALNAAQTLVTLRPTDALSLDARARVELASGDISNAIGTYRQLHALEPNNAEISRRLAGALLTPAPPPTAASSQPAVTKDAIAVRTKEAKTILDTLIEEVPEFTAAIVDRLRLERGLSGDAAALALAQKFVQARPASVPRLIVAGDLETTLGKSELALATYRSAWDKAKNADVLERLYGGLVREKKDAEGVQLLKSWAAEHPADYKIRFLITSAYFNAGRVDDAIAEMESMNGLLPDNPLLLNDLAWLYGERSNPRALEFAQRAFELAPNSPDIMDTLGWLETNKRDKKKGVSLLAKSHDLAPQNQSTAYHYAAALNRVGDQAKAKGVLKKALAENAPFKERRDAELLLKDLGG